MDIYSVLWPTHAIMISVSFLSMLTGAIINIFFKKAFQSGAKRIKVHKTLGIFGGVSGMIAIIIAFIMIQITHQGHFQSLHTILGLIAFLLLPIVPLIANYMGKFKNPKSAMLLHKWLARALLLLMAFLIFIGLRMVGIL